MMIDVQGASLYCTSVDPSAGAEALDPARAPPLVALHGGLGLDHSYLRPWLDELAVGRQVFYYDQRGNGRSQDPTRTPLSHDVLSADADAVRGHLGAEQMVLLGHSYGGFVALEYALRFPQRLAALILCCTAPAVDPREVTASVSQRGTPAQREALFRMVSGQVERDEEYARLWRVALPLSFHRQLDEPAYDAMVARTRCRAAAFAEAARLNLPTYDVTARLGEIRVPTLVLAGAHDPMSPPAQGAARIAAGIVGAELHVLTDSGHFPFIEEPALFREVVLGFLSRHCRRAS
jgi:proline iminopeptidase